LTFVSAVGGYRYVHVRVARMASADVQIALIGHELRHAVEIADAPDVVDSSSLAREYQRIGFVSPSGTTGLSFDSDAAVQTGYRVLRELSGRPKETGCNFLESRTGNYTRCLYRMYRERSSFLTMSASMRST
jgi:hypothetical protein